jgi:hypothetical protein
MKKHLFSKINPALKVLQSFSPNYALFNIISSSGYGIDVELQDVERIIN